MRVRLLTSKLMRRKKLPSGIYYLPKSTWEEEFLQAHENVVEITSSLFATSLIFVLNTSGNYQVADVKTSVLYPDIYTMYNVNNNSIACAQTKSGDWVYIEEGYKITPTPDISTATLYAKIRVCIYGHRYNDMEYYLPVTSDDPYSIVSIPNHNSYIQFLYLPEQLLPTKQMVLSEKRDLAKAFGFSKLYLLDPKYVTSKPCEIIKDTTFNIIPYEEFRKQPNVFRLTDFGV